MCSLSKGMEQVNSTISRGLNELVEVLASPFAEPLLHELFLLLDLLRCKLKGLTFFQRSGHSLLLALCFEEPKIRFFLKELIQTSRVKLELRRKDKNGEGFGL